MMLFQAEAGATGPGLVAGISVAYTVPAPAPAQDQEDTPTDDTSLEELMKQMKSMQTVDPTKVYIWD